MVKRLVSIIILVTIYGLAYSQSDSIYVWNKWCARKDTMLIFTGGNNVIQVYSRKFKPEDIKLKCLDKSLRIGTPEVKGDTLSVLAMPFPEYGKQMRLAILNKKTSKQLKLVSISYDSIPALLSKLGNITTAEAKRKDIMSQTALKAYFPKSLYSYPYTIRQFTFKVTTPKGGATIPVKGSLIPNNILREIGEAPDGTVIEFNNIKATCPECVTRDLNDIKIKIK